MLGEGILAPWPAPAGPATDREPESWLTARNRTATLVVAGVLMATATGALCAVNPKYGIALVGVVALVVLVLVRPFYGGLILAGLVPIISGLAPGVPVSSVRVSEAMIGVIGLTLMIGVRRRDAVPWGALDWMVLAYGVAWFGFGAVDSVVLGEHLKLSDWGTILGQLQFFLVYRGVRISIRTPRQRRIALGIVLVASAPVALLAVLQEAHFPGVASFLKTLTGSSEAANAAPGTVAPLSITNVHRATGPFPNWTSLSGYLFPLLLIFCAVALARQMGPRRRMFVGLAALAVGGLLASEEQSAIIGLLVGVCVLGSMTGQLRKVVRWLLLFVVVAGLVFGTTLAKRVEQEFAPGVTSSQHSFVPQTLDFRWQVWTTQYIPAIEQRPLSGYGDVTPLSVQWPFTESQYVTLLMEGGLPLLAVFALMTWAMVRRSRACARSPDPMSRALGQALTVGIIALTVMDLVWPYMTNGGLPQVLWALLALAEPTRVALEGKGTGQQVSEVVERRPALTVTTGP